MKKIILALLISLFVCPQFASAHKVIVFAWVQNGMIYTQSSFGSKRMAKNCAITVKDDKGAVINQGTTDFEGLYTFKLPGKISSDLVVFLDAGSGHKASWTIPKEELTVRTTDKTKEDVEKVKEKLNKKPSIFKIVGGIGIIFFLGAMLKLFKTQLSQKRKDHQ